MFTRIFWTTVTVFAFVSASADAAIVGTYVDAKEGVSGNTVRLSDGNVNAWALGSTNDNDGLWGRRTTHPAVMQSGDLWETANVEDAPEIRTTITGLVPGQAYAISLIHVTNSNTSTSWGTNAGLTPGGLTRYEFGAGVATGATVDTFVQEQVPLGIAIANGSGEVPAYIDDAGVHQFDDTRSWYDGLAYQAVQVPEPSALTLLGISLLALVRNRRRHR